MTNIYEPSVDENADVAADRSTNPLSRKLNKILESRLDTDKETLEALNVLSTFFTENTLRSRRNLRCDIEKRSLQVNDEFLLSFKDMKQALSDLCQDVNAMNQCCNDMMDRLQAAKSQTHDLINQTTTLKGESQDVQIKQEVVKTFLKAFQLSQEELKILRGARDAPLDESFFEALSKVKKIHQDCKVLLRSSQQTAGIEIMESMALLLETAFERLYRWTQSEYRLLNSDSPEISPLLCQAMESLQDRPILFKYTLDEYANARRNAVVRGFIDALTRGGPGGMPKPIELHSNDPLRYIGDMIAWLHQSVVIEKETLVALLRKCIKNELKQEILDVMSHITEGLCRPLKVRVEHVVMSESKADVLFKLCSILNFYLQTMKQVISSEAQLLQTLDEMHKLCQKMFYNSLSCHCNRLLEKVELPPANLDPTDALKHVLTLLKDVLSCQDSCLISVEDRQLDVPKILSTLVDPLLQMCHVSASMLATADMATYMANCIYLIHSAILLFEFSDKHLEMLQAQSDAHLDTLVSEQASSIVRQIGFGSIYAAIQEYQPKQGPLSNLPGCDALALQPAAEKLEMFLMSPESLSIPQCQLLLSATLRYSLRTRSRELFCNVYNQIHTAVNLPSNSYPDAHMLLPRSPSQVKTLLQ